MPHPDPSSSAHAGPDLSRRSAFRLIGGAAAATALMEAGTVILRPSPARAATMVPQAGPVPVVIDQTAVTDNITVLLGVSAAHPSDMYAATPGQRPWKESYILNFAAGDALSWQVSAASGGVYHLYGFLAAQPGQQFLVSVSGTSSTAAFTTDDSNTVMEHFQRADIGAVTLPSGTSTITLTRTGTLYGDVNFKALELIRQSDLAACQGRVASTRADTGWLSHAGYGLMFQYGAWGFPNNAGPAKSLDQQAADFNVPQFVKMVQETGAAYVIWSFSWWGYHINAPISSVNRIVTQAGGPASPGLTSSRDLIGDVAAACKAAGIRFMLYYHAGYEDSAWWDYQGWPSSTTWPYNGAADRTTFFANWKAVVSEVGTRYGANLDGWFFDDGSVTYYPAKFEELQAAARTGNPNRIISWSGAGGGEVRITDFQDAAFGDVQHGVVVNGSAPVGGNGIFTSGAEQGLLQHGFFTLDDDWGVHRQGQKIGSAGLTSSDVIGWLTGTAGTTGAVSRGVPLSIAMMMYEDGTVADADLRLFNDVRQAVRGTQAGPSTGTTTVNDTDPGITYTGSWNYSANRSFGDYNNDVHYTTANGDSFSYTFTGTGIDVISEKYSDQGLIDVYVDGNYVLTANAASGSRQTQQVVYSARHLSPGSHTIKCVKKSGSYLLLDALRVIPNPTMVNDTDPAIAYTGTWTYSAHRGGGDYGDDVHWTQTVGDSATITFTGTGVDYLGPLEAGGSTANLILDGVQVGTAKAYLGGAYQGQQFLYQVRGLTPGQHTLKLVMTGGMYLQIDAFQIWP